MSKQVYEEYYAQEYDEQKEQVVENLVLYDYQDHLETDYAKSSQLPSLKQIIASFKEGFSKSSFTLNYVLIINSVIIASIIISIWLLTAIGGIFNNIILTLGIIIIVLILMIFESLSLLEKEITQEGEKEKI